MYWCAWGEHIAGRGKYVRVSDFVIGKRTSFGNDKDWIQISWNSKIKIIFSYRQIFHCLKTNLRAYGLLGSEIHKSTPTFGHMNIQSYRGSLKANGICLDFISQVNFNGKTHSLR